MTITATRTQLTHPLREYLKIVSLQLKDNPVENSTVDELAVCWCMCLIGLPITTIHITPTLPVLQLHDCLVILFFLDSTKFVLQNSKLYPTHINVSILVEQFETLKTFQKVLENITQQTTCRQLHISSPKTFRNTQNFHDMLRSIPQQPCYNRTITPYIGLTRN